MAFVHLHVHSQFSILDGVSTVDKLAARAAKQGMSALALTDTSNLYGAVAFYKACKKNKIKAIIGAELHVQPEGLDYADHRREEGGYHLVALVENDVGYRNLCRLVTDAIFDGMHYKPRVSLDHLRESHEGLIFLTGGTKGVIGGPLAGGDPVEARARFDELAAFLSPNHLFLELADVGLDGQDLIVEGARQIALDTGYQTVVTNGVHYLEAEDAPILEVLAAISAGTSMANATRVISPTDQAWLKPEHEMRALFPDDADAIERTEQIAARCDYHFDFDTYHFPAAVPPDFLPGLKPLDPQPDTDPNWSFFFRAFPPPLDFGFALEGPVPQRPEGAGNINGYFDWYSERGLELRLGEISEDLHEEYWDRLRTELEIVKGMGFPAYLLIVAEFINWSKDQGIPVGPGRGSAAGSLVAWAMRITDIDPIRYGLLFERFLNPERVSMPDIDVDFCQDRREEAIAHVRDKYGSELVSQIITYGTLKAKAAIRDVARVMDLNFNEADRIAKLVPDVLGIKLADALDQEPKLRSLRDGDPKVRRVLNVAQAIEGTLRQTGVHAAGVVIADKPLVEYAPLYRDGPEGGPVVQYDMKSAEGIGLIKFDFLGLKTLDQIRDAVIFIEANHGVTVDMSRIPDNDEKTFAMLQNGDALGIFQLESSGMRELLARLKPSSMDDMVALVALYRPGPLQSGMTDDFVERKHGRVPVDYPLPMLEELLSPTYGTIIYQEQVMQIAQVMAKYSLGEADLLRRAMGKKDEEEMNKQRSRFVGGSVENGIDEQRATEIFDLMAKFAAYGFNKSHSAAYGYISYQTAWLKAHYRPEYMAALMTIEAANTDKVLQYILDCRRASIRVEPVCVNHSERHFSVPKPADRPKDADGEIIDVIRFGLAAVKNVGSGAIEAVLDARGEAGGSFATAFDFFERVDYKRVNKRVVENLIKAGALDFSECPRASLFEGLEAACTLGARRQEDKAAGQMGLFGAMTGAKAPDFRFPKVPEWPFSRRLFFEREVLGLYLTGHPMQAHGKDVLRYATASITDLADLQASEEVRVMGLIVESRTIRTRRGDKMAFVRLEDAEEGIECVFFSDAFSRSQAALECNEPVLVTGKLEPGDELKILASTAEPLSDIRARSTREVRFNLEVSELHGRRLDQFKALLKERRGGCKSRLVLRSAGRYEAEVTLPGFPVEPSAAMEESVHALFERADVVALT